MGENVRAHVIISGRVQGVAFRADTRWAAQRIGVFGWVRNRRDGSVEAVIEGEKPRASLSGWPCCGSAWPHRPRGPASTEALTVIRPTRWA